MIDVKWKDEPDGHDYPAAMNYLSLVFDMHDATMLVQRLRVAPVIEHRANDIIRAARYDILGEADHQVAKNLRRIKSGEKLSPVLLIAGQPLIIADGYHRICAAMVIDPDTAVRCKLI